MDSSPHPELFRDLFDKPAPQIVRGRELCATFLANPLRYRREGRFQVHAFVVMPEHIHLLLTPAPNETLEHAIQVIKAGHSHALGAIIEPKARNLAARIH
jgi:hypothetical protein